MRKILILVLFLLPLLLNGCFVYGSGNLAGYVSAVESSWFWDKVYIKPSLESTQEDIFVIDSITLKNQLQSYMVSKQRVNVQYSRHLFVLAQETNEEIVKVEII